MSEPRPGYLLSPRATILALSGVLLAGFALLTGLDTEPTRGAATIAMIAAGLPESEPAPTPA